MAENKTFTRKDKDGIWEYTVRYGEIIACERLEDFQAHKEFSKIKWRVLSSKKYNNQ